MWSGGDKAKITTDAKKYFCGGAFRAKFEPAKHGDAKCMETVDKEVSEAYGKVQNPAQRDNLDRYLQVWYGQPYFNCLIESGISSRGANRVTGPKGMKCMNGYAAGTKKIRMRDLNTATSPLYFDAFGENGYVKWATDMALKGVSAARFNVVELPSEFGAYLEALRAKGSSYLKLANQAERLFREALALVDEKNRAVASLEIAKEVQNWAVWHEGEIKDASNKSEALVKPVSTYVYKVDKTDAYVSDNSFIPEFKVAPKELFDTGALGFGSGTLPLRARAELRRLFVEALIKLRKLNGNDKKLVLLAKKTAVAVKDLKEGDDKIGGLGYKLIGVEVLKVLLKGSDVDKVVLRMRATMASTPYKLLHLYDNRVGPKYVQLMRHAMADLWDMVVEDVGARKLRGDKKLKKRLADSLIKRNRLDDKLSPKKVLRLMVKIGGVDEKNGTVETTRVPEELGEIGLALLAEIYGEYAILSKLKRDYRNALKEAKDKGIDRYKGNSVAAMKAQAELAVKIAMDATDFIDKQTEGPGGVRFTTATAKWLVVD
jgi:hypothetical protein